MLNAFTPGPWESVGLGVYSDYGVADDGGSCTREILFSGHNTRSAGWAEQRANAALISAAPDMLHALEELVAEFDRDAAEWAGEQGHGTPPDTAGVAFARAAIRKALAAQASR